MAKQDGISESKAVAVVAPTMQGVTVGGATFNVVNRVNLPTLKHEDGETVAIRVDSQIREEVTYKEEEVIIQGVKQTITKENVINVVRVTELNSNQPFEYVCNAMTADNLRSAYPENGYVGKFFAILKKGTAAGKRYKETEIVEIAPA